MTLSRPLLWKESAEVRPILLLGLIVFLVFPAIGALEHVIQYRSLEIWTAPWVFGLGGVVAAIIAVGVITPDVTRRFEFIRSQPIPITRWLLTKYFVGLAVLLVILTVPLAINYVFERKASFAGYYLDALLITLPFTWTVIYSVSFALACVIRRTALATVAGMFAMLLIYFAPPILPGLQFLSLAKVTDQLSQVNDSSDWTSRAFKLDFHPSYFLFVFTLLAISAIALLLAIVVIHRDLRIESNRKTIAWTIGIGALTLSLAASLQLGTNMSLLQKIELEPKEHALSTVRNGDAIFLLTNEWDADHISLRRITTGAQISLGPRIKIDSPDNFAFAPGTDILYSMRAWITEDTSIPSDPDGRAIQYPVIHAFRINDASPESTTVSFKNILSTRFGNAGFIFEGSKMTIISGRMNLVFDIADAMHPKLLSSKEYASDFEFHSVGNIMQFRYPSEITIPADQLIAARESSRWYGGNFTPQLYVSSSRDGIRCYARAESGPGYVNYKPVGNWAQSPVEQLVVKGFDPSIKILDGLAAARSGGRVTLFDISNLQHPQRKNYYASPYPLGNVLGILPGERVLMGNVELSVLGKMEH